MFYRCGQCYSTSKLDLKAEQGGDGIRCQHCGYTRRARDPACLGASDEEHLQKTRELAEVSELDLATAYSVLLELITMREGQAIVASLAERGGRASPPDSTASDDTNSVARRPPRSRTSASPTRKRTPRHGWFPLVAAAGLMVLGGGYAVWWVGAAAGAMEQEAHDAAGARKVSLLREVAVERDASGEVTSVAAHDARLVLLGYCGTGEQSRCEPLEVVYPPEPDGNRRYGVFRYFSADSTLYAIGIRRASDGAQRWVAGDGQEPIEVFEAPAVPAGTAAIPAVY